MGWEHKERKAAKKEARLQKENDKMEKTWNRQLKTLSVHAFDMDLRMKNNINYTRGDFECMRYRALKCYNENLDFHKCKRGKALLHDILEIAKQCQMALAWM